MPIKRPFFQLANRPTIPLSPTHSNHSCSPPKSCLTSSTMYPLSFPLTFSIWATTSSRPNCSQTHPLPSLPSQITRSLGSQSSSPPLGPKSHYPSSMHVRYHQRTLAPRSLLLSLVPILNQSCSSSLHHPSYDRLSLLFSPCHPPTAQWNDELGCISMSPSP
uniref:Uncharacterized protein n=1 Tax=Oryza brachyantha TaxID=4533 RepID=J3MG11_ORYBR